MLSARLAQNLVSKYRTILRFQNQDINWTIKDLNYFSDSFLAGLQENKIPQNSTILSWLDEKHGSEHVASLIGSLKNQNKVISLETLAKNDKIDPEYIRKVCSEINPSIFLVSPNQLVNGVIKSNLIAEAFPEIKRFGKNGYLEISKVPNLKFLIQTGFYAKPGFIKFRDFCVYSSPTMRQIMRPDINKSLDDLVVKTTNYPVLETKDHLYFVSGFNKVDLVLRSVLESTSTGNFLNFIPRETIEKTDLGFINSVDEDVRTHIYATSETVNLLKAKVTRKNSVFVVQA